MNDRNTTAVPVITIDGPGGSGKGTVAMRLAQELDWHFLDSGALYRIVAVAAMDRNIAVDDEEASRRSGPASGRQFWLFRRRHRDFTRWQLDHRPPALGKSQRICFRR